MDEVLRKVLSMVSSPRLLLLLHLCYSAAAFRGERVAGGGVVRARVSSAPRRHAGLLAAVKERRLFALPAPAGEADAAVIPPLPLLDAEEEQRLRDGKRVRWQQPPGAGGEGSGFAVMELRADESDIWRAVSDFGRYDELISTVRTATRYGDLIDGLATPDNVCRYSFLCSRIRLRLDVCFTVDDARRYAAWQLDKPSWVLNDSTGYWRVEPCADRPGFVRVWFCVRVKLSKRVPGFVIRLVSRLGLDKATRWLTNLEATAHVDNDAGNTTHA